MTSEDVENLDYEQVEEIVEDVTTELLDDERDKIDVLEKLDEAESKIDDKIVEKLEKVDGVELSEEEVEDLKDKLDVEIEIDIQEEVNKEVMGMESEIFDQVEDVVDEVVEEKEVEDYDVLKSDNEPSLQVVDEVIDEVEVQEIEDEITEKLKIEKKAKVTDKKFRPDGLENPVASKNANFAKKA